MSLAQLCDYIGTLTFAYILQQKNKKTIYTNNSMATIYKSLNAPSLNRRYN